MTENSDPKNELSKYLKRREVRTMDKDLGRFHEGETQKERERVAKLETEEAAAREKRKLEGALEEAEERQKTEQSSLQREEELKKLKAAREQKEALLGKEEAAKIEEEKAQFKEKFRGMQEKEELKRREFLERVETKITPGPSLATAPVITKPYFIGKLWIRIALAISILMVLATTGVLLYWYFVLRTPTVMPMPTPIQTAVKIRVPPLVIQEMILEQGYEVPSKPRTIDAIIVHSIYNALGGDPYDINGVISEYKQYNVAAHYLIDRDGIIYHTVPDEAIAYHAGISQMPDGRTGVNDFSVGIELIYTKNETPTDKQYQALAGLIKYIQKNNNIFITPKNILGHNDIAPDRKTDPWNFDWGKLVEK